VPQLSARIFFPLVVGNPAALDDRVSQLQYTDSEVAELDEASSRPRERLGALSRHLVEFGNDARNNCMEISMHKLRINAQNAIPSAADLPVAAFISLAPPCMISSVDLNHEVHLRREEIHDVSEQHDLAPKRAPELA
jgi:hypothetical protein